MGETYWEVSPSGTGLRALVRGKIDKTIKSYKAHTEIYRSQRYLTVTGDHVEGTPEETPAPMTLDMLVDRVEEAESEVGRVPVKGLERGSWGSVYNQARTRCY